MHIFIDNILEEQALEAITELLSKDGLFQSGKQSAGHVARQVKQNQQASVDAVETKGAVAKVKAALLEHPVFNAAAVPDKFAGALFNRFDVGDFYGDHIDNPLIGGIRTDLSFTLFLSDPESYEGGELILRSHSGDEPVKLSKGSLVLYPATSVHCVAPVTAGTRLAAVGWLQSRVRLAEHREILFDLDHCLSQLPDQDDSKGVRLSLLKTRSNLMRLWAS